MPRRQKMTPQQQAERLKHGNRYLPEDKRTALELYERLGPDEASRRTGIPRATVCRWAQRAGLKAPVELQQQTLTAIQVSRKVVKERLARKLLDIAEKELERLEKPIEYHTASNQVLVSWTAPMAPGDRKQTLLTAAIAIDKSALLAGDATGRVEHLDIKELDAALNEAIPDPEARRKLALRVLRGGAGGVGQGGGSEPGSAAK